MSQLLRNYRILLADADQELARVIKMMLRELGFSDITTTRNGLDARRLLNEKKFDFLITEWNLQQQDGVGIIQDIRKDPNSLNPTLPVIMLTGRAEKIDVEAARDVGVNEYVIKPFSVKSIFNRIERIIENPRAFVVASSYVGPDRRRRGEPPPGVANRRTASVKQQEQPKDVAAGIHAPNRQPQIWLPDFSLKNKLGKGVLLVEVITPAVLEQAQAAIDAITDDSLKWIQENLRELELLYKSMTQGEYSSGLPSEMGEVALTINSRAGTFGYGRASEISYILYLFCRKRLQPENAHHHMVIRKHIEVLKVLLGNNMRGTAGALGTQIVGELRQLVEKYGS